MISWRLTVPAVLVAAAVAGCIAYFINPAPPLLVEADERSLPTAPKAIGRPDPGVLTNNQPTEDEIIAYQRAAEAILKRAQNSKASADEPVITGAVPLPKKRPLPRP
jgi:hypothetical protein